MALTPDEVKRLKDMLKEIEQLSIKLKANINTTSLQDVEANAGTIKKLFKDLKEEWEDLTSGISIAAQGFRDVVKEISNQNIGLNTSIKAYKGLVSIADQIQSYQRGYNDLTIKDIANIRKKIELRKIELENSQKSLQEEQKAAKDKEKDLKRQLDYYNRLSQSNIKLSKAEHSERRRINAELKQTQKEHKGITASMKQNAALLNDQDESFKNLELSVSEAARKINQEFVQNLDKNFKNLVEETQSTEDSIKKISKSFSVFESIAQKALDHQSEANELSEKDAKKLLEKLESERKRIIAQQELLKVERESLETKIVDNRLALNSKKTAIEILENEAKSRRLTKEELADLKKLKQDESTLLETQKDINSELEVNAQATEKVSKLIKGQNEEYNKIKSSLIDIAKQSKLVSIGKLDEDFKNLVNDVRDTDQIFKNMSKSFKNLSGLFEKVQEYQENITDVSKEDVEEIMKKVKLEMQSLTNQAESLRLEEERLKTSLATNKSEQQNIENNINAIRNSIMSEEEKAKLIAEEETKKNGLLDIENELNGKLEANNALTIKTQEYIAGQNEEYNKLVDTLDEVEKGVNNINKSFGLNIGKNLSGALGKAGLGNLANMLGIDKATKDMAKFTAKLTNNGQQALGPFQQLQVLGKGLASMGGNLLKGFNPWMIALTGIVKIIQFFIDSMFEADQQVTDIAKSFNISKDAARGVREEAFKISDQASYYAKTLGNQVLLQKEIVAANLKINELLGVSIDLTNDLGESGKFLVAQFAAASKFLKLGEEEQKGLLNLTLNTGKEVDDINKTVLGTTRLFKLQSGVLLDERKVLKTVLESSNAIKLSTKGGLEGLTKSAIEASKLGLSLQKVSDIANGLLDFESQIASELEAEVITGKELNLELAQQAALNNDLATVASEVAKNIGSAAEYTKMNRLEQEALAKAVGMSREELADVLTTQENLNKLRSTYNTLGEDTINQLKASGKLTSNQLQALDQIKAGKGSVADYFKSLQAAGMAQEDLIKLMGEQSYASLASQTAQEKFNESLEKAKETFSRFVDGGFLDKLSDAIIKFTDLILGAEGREKAAQKTAEEIKTSEGFKTASKEAQQKFSEAEEVASDQIGGIEKFFLNLIAPGNFGGIGLGDIKDIKAKAASAGLERAKTEGVEQVFGAKPEQTKTYAMGGYTGDGGKDEIAGLVHKGEYVINQDQTKKYKPLLEKINNGEPLLDTINDKGAALDKQMLNASQNTSKTSNTDIASSVVALIDKISNILPTTSTSSYKPDTTLLPENNIKPSEATSTQPTTSNTNITVDNSQIADAINTLAKSLNIVLTIDGKQIAMATAAENARLLPQEFTKTAVA